MAVPPDRSTRNLHNFTLPRLKWGNQRLLQCMKSDNNNSITTGDTSTDHSRSSASEATDSDGLNRRTRRRNDLIRPRSSNPSKSSNKSPLNPNGGVSDNDGIEGVRQKLMTDLRVAADRMKVPVLEEKEKEKESDISNSPKPSNLRSRRAPYKGPNESCGSSGGGDRVDGGGGGHAGKQESPVATVKSTRLRNVVATEKETLEMGENSQRPKFSLTLTKEEIESDFLAMTGAKPPRRPKKKPKAVQKQWDVRTKSFLFCIFFFNFSSVANAHILSLFPGKWLTEITPERYKVPDFPEPGKS
ncbi:unnamed protein product [Ilex paraguariensis]|uniref:Uncharacterized protein n=1 Tax=Ilex paraguariensis TaxID=185542 RepID=A0ABC8QRL5_9AQUA